MGPGRKQQMSLAGWPTNVTQVAAVPNFCFLFLRWMERGQRARKKVPTVYLKKLTRDRIGSRQ